MAPLAPPWIRYWKTFLSGEKVEGKRCLKLRAQVLRGAASRVGPLALRLREGGPLFSGGCPLKTGGGGSVNDNTSGTGFFHSMTLFAKIGC